MRKLLFISSLTAFGLMAQKPTVMTPSHMGTSAPFQTYSKLNPAVPSASEENETDIPNQLYLPRGKSKSSKTLAPAAVTAQASTMYNQTVNGTLPVSVLANYVGLGNGFNAWTNQGLLPSDTTLGVGNGQILQWVNLRLTVLNKTNGALLLSGSGYVNANQIWLGLSATSICRTQNNGDPTVQYDRISGRWLLHQFAFNSTNTQNAFCFAVSQTSDATGAYNLYEFDSPNVLPDYPKIGVWPDAYYLTSNSYTYPGGSYSGSKVCAFDRSKMLTGAAAAAVCFSAGTNTDGEWFSAVPGDFEGTLAPPANTTAYIVNGDWFNLNAPPYSLRIRRFHPDFVTPGNSTLDDGFGGGPGSFVQLPFDNSVVGACGDGGGACVPQPGTTRKLDSLAMRPMYRMAYRNLGAGRESLVFTQSVDPAGAAVAGIQLIEIRNPGANPPQIYNNVNFNPDTTNRWMGAAASDKVGNIGIGYSVSSATISPGIRIAGRLRNDIRNTLRGELNIQTGVGAQTASAQRWGDYSTMQIDPDDDCTFWFTTEYTNTSSSANWATRIISFRFNSCQ